MKKILLPVISLLMCGLTFTSCSDDTEITPDALGDVYIKTIKDGEITKYALYAYSSANYQIESVNVISPDEEIEPIELASIGHPYTFTNYSNKENMPVFEETLPAEGEYTFNITSSDNATMTRTNNLTDAVADITEITKAEFDGIKINIEWNETDNNNAFIIRLLNSKDEEIFSTPFLKDSVTSFSINDLTYGWINKETKVSDVAKVKVLTILFENSEQPSKNEIQSIGEATMEVVDNSEEE